MNALYEIVMYTLFIIILNCGECRETKGNIYSLGYIYTSRTVFIIYILIIEQIPFHLSDGNWLFIRAYMEHYGDLGVVGLSFGPSVWMNTFRLGNGRVGRGSDRRLGLYR